jgi:hypothetical protein
MRAPHLIDKVDEEEEDDDDEDEEDKNNATRALSKHKH